MTQDQLRNKVIIVTGGNGFLGKVICAHLKEGGAMVEILDKSGDVSVDITDQRDVEKRVNEIAAEHGRIDGLVHAAAVDAVPGVSGEESPHFAPYDEYDVELWQKVFDVNVLGAQIVTQKVAKIMKEQGSGSVVFIASDLGLIAPHNHIYGEGRYKDIAYTTSKAAIIGLSRNWASFLGGDSVRVNCLVPGGVYNGQPEEFVKLNAELNMLGRMAKEYEYSGAIEFLLSEASSYMTGANLVIDGGRTAW